jgi:hypothetical protein
VRTTRFWNNHHQVTLKVKLLSKKPNNLRVFEAGISNGLNQSVKVTYAQGVRTLVSI